jgi:hypothetical protein
MVNSSALRPRSVRGHTTLASMPTASSHFEGSINYYNGKFYYNGGDCYQNGQPKYSLIGTFA